MFHFAVKVNVIYFVKYNFHARKLKSVGIC
ncbi:hypothetical protein SAMN05216323_102436 [Williamwhitmania taraxaci]|uniref:Uncharacterized protein n=1 Tax=Williamwhitmania taraxaci TaxID=1640674 RepID=A0A1G6KCX3_9BACT|nr:hypothetical protein SAMN05216323_102436 [Williamwhitmania taraxaci]